VVLVLRRTSTVWPAAIVPGDIFCRKRALTGIQEPFDVRKKVILHSWIIFSFLLFGQGD